MLTVDLENLDIVLLSGYATIFVNVSSLFWAFTAVTLSESSQVSKESDAFANPSSRFNVPMGQLNHTNCWAEVFYCLDIYVGVIIMTLGVLGDHLVI